VGDTRKSSQQVSDYIRERSGRSTRDPERPAQPISDAIRRATGHLPAEDAEKK